MQGIGHGPSPFGQATQGETLRRCFEVTFSQFDAASPPQVSRCRGFNFEQWSQKV
jgi:hypothetical protein